MFHRFLLRANGWIGCTTLAWDALLEKVMNVPNVIRFSGMNFSQITDDLFVGNTPSTGDYDRLRDLGIRLIINMRYSRAPHPDLHPQPIATLWLPSIDSPFFPISISKLMRGAQSALETIQHGGRIYAHCAYGRHRGPAMGACILIAQGYEPQAAMKLIKQRRAVADPFAWYVRPRIIKFAHEWMGK
jgi:protein tyrosine phosphatase (PTP) superfamily phosphohydrolase (DUF442 family)